MMILAMAVCKGQAGAPIVIGSWKINPGWFVWTMKPFVQEITVINAVRVFIQKNKNPNRVGNGGNLEELNIARIILVDARARDLAGVTHHRVHGITAYASRPPRLFLGSAQRM